MTKRKKRTTSMKQPTMFDNLKTNGAKIVLVLLTGAGGVGSVGAYQKGDNAEVKAAVVEQRVNRLEKDHVDIVGKNEREQRQMQRLDRRLTRMEVMMDLTLDAMKVPNSKRPAREAGPEDSFE